MDNHRIHTLPLNDEVIHFASPKCPCQPLQDPYFESIYVHHAMDNREATERQGKPIEGKGWVNIKEWIN